MKKKLHIDRFEQFFNENTLKTAISILKKDQIDLVSKPKKGGYFFVIEGKNRNEVNITRRAQNIVSYSCSCESGLCEHICASFFYLQKELLNDLLTGTKSGRKKEADLFNFYCKQIKQEWARLKKTKPGEEDFLKFAYTLFNLKRDEFFISLALLTVLSDISLRQSDKKDFSLLEKETKSKFQKLFLKGIDHYQESALIKAAVVSLSSQRRFNSELFSFLIVFAGLVIKDKSIFSELKNLLDKKILKYHYPADQNKKRLAYFHLRNAEQCLDSKRKKVKQKEIFTEYYLALAERELCLKKPAKALKFLEEGYQEIKNKRPANFISYLESVVETARIVKTPDTELFFLKQILIHTPHINPALLRRVKVLLPYSDRNDFYDEVISAIKESPRETFEKLSDILWEEKRWDELVKEIKKQQNKFRLLNEVAIQKLPEYDSVLFEVYIQQLLRALSEASETHYQQKIFNDAKRYFERLPDNIKLKLLSDIAFHLPQHGYLRNSILNQYSV